MIHVLTGAGYSANIGTPLATEVSDQVFCILHGRGETAAAERVKKEGGYEQACVGLRRTDGDLLAIKAAVVKVFRQIDESHKQLMPNHSPNTHLLACIGGMMRLLTVVGKKGNVFTTNLDMLVERYLSSGGDSKFVLAHPYYQDNALWFRQGSTRMERADAPSKYMEDRECPDGRLYVKLHGSLHWTDSGEEPVIGLTKREDVLSHNVLRRFWDLFDKSLTASGAKLVVVGYGFNDEFVNEMIVRGISTGDLKLFIWDTMPMLAMMEKLRKVAAGLPEAVAGYCSQSARDRFTVTCPGDWLEYCPDVQAFVAS